MNTDDGDGRKGGGGMKRDPVQELANLREIEALRRKNDTQARRISRFREIALDALAQRDKLREAVKDHRCDDFWVWDLDPLGECGLCHLLAAQEGSEK